MRFVVNQSLSKEEASELLSQNKDRIAVDIERIV